MSEPQKMTTKEVCEFLLCTPMTVYNYRMGHIAGKAKIPFHTKPRGTRNSVFFYKAEVALWAKRNKVKTSEDPVTKKSSESSEEVSHA